MFVSDPAVLAVVEKYKEQIEEQSKVEIGSTRVTLLGDVNCRLDECNFGNLIADAMVDYVSCRTKSGTMISFIEFRAQAEHRRPLSAHTRGVCEHTYSHCYSVFLRADGVNKKFRFVCMCFLSVVH